MSRQQGNDWQLFSGNGTASASKRGGRYGVGEVSLLSWYLLLEGCSMQKKNRFHPTLEALEERWAPALSVTFDGSNLTIGDGGLLGSPDGGTLTITQGAGTVTVADSQPLGTYAVTGKITVNLNNDPANTVFAMGGNSTAGSIAFHAGNGSDTVQFTGGGTVGGNLRITSGTGADSVTMGTTNVVGGLTIKTNGGADSVTFAGASTIGGNASLEGVNTLAMVSQDVGGTLSYNSSTEQILNSITLGASTIGGNASLTAGDGADSVTFNGLVEGSATVSLRRGADSVSFGSSTIGANLSVFAGKGADTVTLAGLVQGDALVKVGNGNNIVSVTGTVSGTSLEVITGAGADSVNFAGTAQGARLEVSLGDGNDTFSLNSNALGSGDIDGGFGINTFTSSVVINFPLKLKNFD
jgi:fibronectin-binding autotransporter adhesin